MCYFSSRTVHRINDAFGRAFVPRLGPLVTDRMVRDIDVHTSRL